MRCHVCNAEVGDGQRFCHECGESLSGVSDPTVALDMPTLFEGADQGSVIGELVWSDAKQGVSRGDVGDAVAPLVRSTDVGPEVDEDGLPPTQAVGLDMVGEGQDIWTVPDQSVGDDLDPDGTAYPSDVLASVDRGKVLAGEMTFLDQGMAITTAISTDPTATTAESDETPVGIFGATIGQYSPVFDDADDPDIFPSAHRPFRFRMSLLVGVIAIFVAVFSALADVTDVRTDRVVPGIENRLRGLDDLGTNLTIAMFVGVGVLAIGGLLHAFHHRWGAGLAGGAGLAVGGWAALTIGLAEVSISSAERVARDPNTPGPFVLTVTRDVGFWLVVVVGAGGFLAFFCSLTAAGIGGRPGLDPWIAAFGALGGGVAAIGPIVPIADAAFSDNFGGSELPSAFFVGRLMQVVLFGGSVMVGFLLVRAYGLGFAAGGLSVPTFMWSSTLINGGDRSIGIGVGNLGTSNLTTHAITNVGMGVVLVMFVVAATVAVYRSRRLSADY